MAEENEECDVRVHKSWLGTYKKCRDCGTTERACIGRGLCSACYARHRKEGTLDRYSPIAPEKAPKKGKAQRRAKRPAVKKPAPARARASKGKNLVEVHFVVNLDELSPKVRAEIKDRAAAKIAERALARL